MVIIDSLLVRRGFIGHGILVLFYQILLPMSSEDASTYALRSSVSRDRTCIQKREEPVDIGVTCVLETMEEGIRVALALDSPCVSQRGTFRLG